MKKALRQHYEKRLERLVAGFPIGSDQSKTSRVAEVSYYRTPLHLDAQRFTNNGLGECVLDITIDLDANGRGIKRASLVEHVGDEFVLREHAGGLESFSLRALRSVAVETARVHKELVN